MDRIITENDLLLFHYKEVTPEIHKYIRANLHFNPQWHDFLKMLSEVDNALEVNQKGPSKTTLSIILEESMHQENPTF